MKHIVPFYLLVTLLVGSPLYASTALNFSFTDLEGTTYILSDLKGTPLVINIGSHW
ncbi:MAG: hypothetical protein KKG47_05450 [Proteobacteria bacterium]|nr:hypothetical protein [Pseudomonadota bacterium]MBU1736921.1 hypothetical protein [Pseudomonadota bacterium]